MSSPPPPTGNHHKTTSTAYAVTLGSRRIFTKEDEIQLLKSFSKLADPDVISTAKVQKLKNSMGRRFSDTQLTDKLRKLRRKYQKMGRSDLGIKNGRGYDREVYELSSEIWGKDESFVESDDEEMSIEKNAEVNIDQDGLNGSDSAEIMTAGADGLRDVEMETDSRDALRGLNVSGIDDQDESRRSEVEVPNEERETMGIDVEDELRDSESDIDNFRDIYHRSRLRSKKASVPQNVNNEDGLGMVNVNARSEADGGGMNGNVRSEKGRIARRKVDVLTTMSTPPPPTRNNPSITPSTDPTNVTTPPLFQRIFTEEDEIHLLKSFSRLATSSNPTKITIAAVRRFKKSLGQKFSDNQLYDKLKRLRRKYHKMAKSKSKIRSVHDREVYEISRKIWGKNESSRKPEVYYDDDDHVDEEEEEELSAQSAQEYHEVNGQDDGEINNQNGSRGLSVSNIDIPSAEREVAFQEIVREDGLRDAEIEIDTHGELRKRRRRVSVLQDGMNGINDEENANIDDWLRDEEIDIDSHCESRRRKRRVSVSQDGRNGINDKEKANVEDGLRDAEIDIDSHDESRRTRVSVSQNGMNGINDRENANTEHGLKDADIEIDSHRESRRGRKRVSFLQDGMNGINDKENANTEDGLRDAEIEIDSHRESRRSRVSVSQNGINDKENVNIEDGLGNAEIDIGSHRESRRGRKRVIFSHDGMNDKENANTEDGLKDAEIEIDSHRESRSRVSVSQNGINDKENANIDGLTARRVDDRSEVDGGGMNGNVRSGLDNGDRITRREVDASKYPFLLKEFSRCLPENPVWREGFKEMSEEKLEIWNEEWKKLQIEEARIMAKRAGMLQEQMKELLELT